MIHNFQQKTGQWLRLQRRMAGLTLNELSRQLGISYQQLQKYEAGTNALPLERLARLLSVLKLDAAEVAPLLQPDASTPLPQPTSALRSINKYCSGLAAHEQRAVLACVRELAKGVTS